MIWLKSNFEQMLSHNTLNFLDLYKYVYTQKLPKCLIFCKLRYVTYQGFCRYCGISQKAPSAQDFLLTEISVQSVQDLLLKATGDEPAG